MASEIMTMGRDVARRRAELLIFVALSVGVAIATPFVDIGSRAAALALVGLAACALLPITSTSTRSREVALRPSLAVVVLALFQLGFWVAFGRLEHAALTIALARTDVLGLPPSPATLELLFVAPLVVLAPLVCGAWRVLERHGLEPSIAVKFGLGFVMLALSGLCLATGVEWSLASGTVGLGAVAACVTMLGLAALCLGPASSRLVAAREHERAWVGAWVLCVVLGRAVGASTGGLTGASTLALEQVFSSCLSVGFAAVIAGVVLGIFWRPLAQLSAGQQPRRTRSLVWARGTGTIAGL